METFDDYGAGQICIDRTGRTGDRKLSLMKLDHGDVEHVS